MCALASNATPAERRLAARRRRDAARRYRPERIRLLIVGQMPPNDLDRYFYFEGVSTADYLFRAIVPHFLGDEPARLDKREQLVALRARGMYLIDLKPDPCSTAPVGAFVDDLVRRTFRLAPVAAILVKVDVYDHAFTDLRKAGVPVIDSRLPFPSTGNQTDFANGFRDALAVAGLRSLAPRER